MSDLDIKQGSSTFGCCFHFVYNVFSCMYTSELHTILH